MIHTLVVPSAKAIKIEWNVAGKEEKGEGGPYQYIYIIKHEMCCVCEGP